MEMNFAYFEATLAHLEKKGFAVDVQTDEHHDRGQRVFTRKRARCKLVGDYEFLLEALSYDAGHDDFFLEIVQAARMRSFSFPLDSWKFHPNRIEFKYRDDPETGLGLALTFDLS